MYLLLKVHEHLCPHQRLTVLHYNHHLRHQADEEARFVEQLTVRLGHLCIVGHLNVATRRDEATLRTHRHNFFKESIQNLGIEALFLGHQRNDILETMLMRLIRGSGSDGLSALRPVQNFNDGRVYLRPLIGMTHEQICAELTQRGQTWCEDTSNASTHYLRNRVRHRIIPELLTISQHNALQGAARSRQLLEEDATALNELCFQLFPQGWEQNLNVDAKDFDKIPRAMIRRALQRWVSAHHLELNAHAFDQLVDAVCLKKYYTTSAKNGSIYFNINALSYLKNIQTTPTRPIQLFCDGAERIFGNFQISATANSWTPDMRFGDGQTCAYVALKDTEIEVRTWQPGDRYIPLGCVFSKKLHDCFVDKKIKRHLRQLLPIFTRQDGTILWAPGLPPNDHHKIQPQDTTCVQLSARRFI